MNALTTVKPQHLVDLEARVMGRIRPSDAARWVKRLIALYPGQKYRDEDEERVYLAGLAQVLSEWPEWVVERSCHPTRGLASQVKFRPTPAELQSFCGAVLRPEYERLQQEKRVCEMDARRAEPTPSQADREAVRALCEQVTGELRARGKAAFEDRSRTARNLSLRTQCPSGWAIRQWMLEDDD